MRPLTVGAIWDGISEGYRDAAAEGDWAEFPGGGAVFDIGTAVVGVGAVAKGGRVAGVADDVADASRALDGVDNAARLAGRGDDVVRAGTKSRSRVGWAERR